MYALKAPSTRCFMLLTYFIVLLQKWPLFMQNSDTKSCVKNQKGLFQSNNLYRKNNKNLLNLVLHCVLFASVKKICH